MFAYNKTLKSLEKKRSRMPSLIFFSRNHCNFNILNGTLGVKSSWRRHPIKNITTFHYNKSTVSYPYHLFLGQNTHGLNLVKPRLNNPTVPFICLLICSLILIPPASCCFESYLSSCYDRTSDISSYYYSTRNDSDMDVLSTVNMLSDNPPLYAAHPFVPATVRTSLLPDMLLGDPHPSTSRQRPLQIDQPAASDF